MCSLYSMTTPQAAMRTLFGVAPEFDRLGNAPPLPAIFPKAEAPVVRLTREGVRELIGMHWGFVMPQVSKRTGKPIQPKAVNNARDDKVRSSPFWKSHFEARRCLIPASGFCEAQGLTPATYTWFGVAEDGAPQPFAFAGIWRVYRGPYGADERELLVSSMLTTTPNALVAPVHPDRMPVILDPADYETWLTGPLDAAAALLRPFPAERMVILGVGEGLKAEPPHAAAP